MWGRLTLLKLTKSHLIYSVSRVNFGGLGALFGGDERPKSPVATGLVLIVSILFKLCEHMYELVSYGEHVTSLSSRALVMCFSFRNSVLLQLLSVFTDKYFSSAGAFSWFSFSLSYFCSSFTARAYL